MMSEEVAEGSKRKNYVELLPKITSLLEGEVDVIANLANVAAALKATFNFHWVGFYRRVGNELVLGPFQGPVACTRIALGRGVCGMSAKDKRTILVPDVQKFPDHIACSSASKSEIVVPLLQDGEVKIILDIDSDKLNDFDAIDQEFLEMIVAIIRRKYTI